MPAAFQQGINEKKLDLRKLFVQQIVVQNWEKNAQCYFNHPALEEN